MNTELILTEDEQNAAIRMHEHFPFREVFLVVEPQDRYLICKPTRHYLNRRVRLHKAKAVQVLFTTTAKTGA